MILMNWSDKLDVGVDLMNNQHKKILDLMNNLYSAFENSAPYEQFLPILNELKDYTIQHFSEEEAYMESVNFSGLATHKQIHIQLLEKLTEHYQQISEDKKLDQKFFDFLKLWLSSHIQGIDVKYGKGAA